MFNLEMAPAELEGLGFLLLVTV